MKALRDILWLSKLNMRFSTSFLALALAGCSHLGFPPSSPKHLTLFISPFCPIFQRSTQEMRPREFQAAMALKDVGVTWRPVEIFGTECDRMATKLILCGRRTSDPSWVVEHLASTDIPLSSCTSATLEELFESVGKASTEVLACVRTDGESLLRTERELLMEQKINAVPYYSLNSGPVTYFSNLKTLAEQITE